MRAFLILLLVAACGSDREDARPAGHRRMVALLAEIRDRTPDENPWLGDRRARELRERRKRLAPGDPDACALHAQLGMAELILGNEEAATEHLLESTRLGEYAGADLALAWKGRSQDPVALNLGIAFLRLGETRNCCALHTAESCILPITGGGIHSDRFGSERALEALLPVLRAHPRGSSPYMQALWLLNIAHMTLGDYPEGVPEEYRIPPSAFESEEPFPRFRDVAHERGLATFSLSGGAVCDDLDGDGDLDLLVSTWDPAGPMRYFEGVGGGSFRDRSKEAGLEGLLGGLNMVQADYDNDGDADVLVLRGAWLGPAGRHPNSLLRNDGGRFTDVTFEAGLGEVHYPTQTAAWADYDNDGDLDVYIGNEEAQGLVAPSQLFRNEGDGTFRDVAEAAGVTNGRWTKGVAWGDYDEDGDPDLYVSNLGQRNRLYRNDGDGTFTDVAAPAQVTGPESSFPAWFWDFDNDGHLDLYVSAYAADISHLAGAYLGLEQGVEIARLYKGDGKGGFRDVARQVGLRRPNSPMGANFGDVDHDGFLDFYLGTGDPLVKNLMPNVFFHNRGGESFADVTTAGGFGHLQKAHAIVFADLDGDGDLDVFEQMGGALPVDRYYDVLFENPGFGNHWIGVHAVGTESNRSAIGARIRVVAGGRSFYRHVNSGGSFGANPLRQSIGVGKAERIERLEVFWPKTGKTQVFEDLPVDAWVRVVEGETALR